MCRVPGATPTARPVHARPCASRCFKTPPHMTPPLLHTHPFSQPATNPQGARRYLYRASGARVSVRLALLQDAHTQDTPSQYVPSQGISPQDALLFELPRTSSPASVSEVCAGGGVVAASDASAPVASSRMSLVGTMLGQAIAEQRARYIKDVGAYMQVRVQIQAVILMMMISYIDSYHAGALRQGQRSTRHHNQHAPALKPAHESCDLIQAWCRI